MRIEVPPSFRPEPIGGAEKSLFNGLLQLFAEIKDLFTKVNAFASSGLDKLEMTGFRHFDRSEMKWSEVEKSSFNGNNMKKVIKQ